MCIAPVSRSPRQMRRRNPLHALVWERAAFITPSVSHRSVFFVRDLSWRRSISDQQTFSALHHSRIACSAGHSQPIRSLILFLVQRLPPSAGKLAITALLAASTTVTRTLEGA